MVEKYYTMLENMNLQHDFPKDVPQKIQNQHFKQRAYRNQHIHHITVISIFPYKAIECCSYENREP
jgi:hypothetical protein